ncbi:MAG: ABC transporter permease subunit [Dysosmobacter sp.]|nr:ABC transporter permease subunit [Dysosmobacter sp.]
MIPLITILVNRFATMIGTTVLIESIFVIPGLGSLMISSITSRDFLVVENCVLIIAIFVTAANLLIDILYGFIDPRIRDV